MGGLSKKAYQIKSIKTDQKKPALILDAGNLLFKQTTVSQSQELITALGIMEIYQRLSYDAVAVGPHDLAAGLGFLHEAENNGFPWLSANILDAGKKPLFRPSIVIKRAGLTIGIIGLTEPTAPVPQGITVTGWRNALSGQLAVLEKTCDLLVVLSNLSDQENADLVRDYPQIHILLSANRNQGNILPRVVNSTLITQTYSQGKYLGMLDLEWLPLRPWGKDFGQEDLLLHDRLSDLDRQILRAERLNSLPGAAPANLPDFRQERQNILKRIETLKQQVGQSENNKETFNFFQHSFIALNRNLPDDPEIAERVSHIKARINAHNQDSVTTNPQHNQEILSETDRKPAGYTGFSRCGECHASQTEFWKTTGHAQAYQTLMQQRQNFNLDCLPCHVTHAGNSTQEGAAEKKENLVGLHPTLRGVGCESCHGPGYAHAADPDHVRPQRKVEEKVCLACHAKDHSPGFDHKVKITKVSCPAN